MVFYFKKLMQNFELKRVRGVPKGHPLAPLYMFIICQHTLLQVLVQARLAQDLLGWGLT